MLTEIRPLKSEADYDDALKEIERYFEREPEPGTPEGDRFDLSALVIEDYERKRWPIDPPDPVEAIKYSMALTGRRQADFARLIGSRSRASEIPQPETPPHHRGDLEAQSRVGNSGREPDQALSGFG